MDNILLPILNIARNLYFEDSSDEENVIEKVDNFAEITVPLMKDEQFKKHFRMSPSTFEDFLQKMHHTLIANNINLENRTGYPRCALGKELMITVWYLGNVESFRSVSDRFGVIKSTCWDILQRTCRLLLKVKSYFNIIAWPTERQQVQLSNGFTKHGFTGVVGCIDGSHIKIVAPKVNPNSYVNRKGYHSLLLQAVCDNEMFTDIYIGQAGSVHDYTLYKRSDLYESLQAGNIQFFNDYHLIGDLAYKLQINLLVGFKNNEYLTLRQKNFNFILNKIRVKSENALALLKGRFRRLKFIETVRYDLAVLNIMSACILHNICIVNGDLDEFIDVDVEKEKKVKVVQIILKRI